MVQKNKYEINMTDGPLFMKMVKFTVPIILTDVLQLFYNAADVIVVGKFAGKESLAAVGSTSSLINLLVKLFIGISLGAGVVVAQNIGAQNKSGVEKSTHTSMSLSFIIGIFVCLLGFFTSTPCLKLMSTPNDVLNKASLYMKIYYLGIPGLMVYNFGASILRSAGDTRRPLYILSASGIVNVLLNLVFVIVFKMDVAGVALATIIAQYISCVAIFILLIKTDGTYKIEFKKLTIHKKTMGLILRFGIPIGVQSSLFSISNVLIQSAVNSFGSTVMAGNAAAASLEGFVYTAIDSPAQAALTFASQNTSAGKIKRVKSVWFFALLISAISSAVFCPLFLIFKEPLLSIYSSAPEVIAAGAKRMNIIVAYYLLCGCMDVTSNTVRGLGYSVTPMVTTVFFVCVMRIIWIYTVFPAFKTITSVYWSYPISWALAFAVHTLFMVAKLKAAKAKFNNQT